MEESVFTKIINGEIPAHKIYEDDKVLAFLDIAPKNEGHTLVIPKEQTEFVWDLDDETYDHLMRVVKQIAHHLREVLPYKYVHESIVGTDVPHAHVHLVPFDTTDQLHDRPPQGPDHAALAALADKIRLT